MSQWDGLWAVNILSIAEFPSFYRPELPHHAPGVQ